MSSLDFHSLGFSGWGGGFLSGSLGQLPGPAAEDGPAGGAAAAQLLAELSQQVGGRLLRGGKGGGLPLPRDVLPPQQEEAVEEVAEQPQAASYTADMDVSEITQRMTVDEAKAVVVQIGTCRGWTLKQVAQRRPASLKWYLYGCDQADNILKAAASVLLDNLQQKAG